MVACATISHRVRQAGYTSAASAPNAARELLAASPMSVPPGLSELLREAWTIQVGFVRKWIFSFQTPSHGTKWNRQLGNTTCIRRRPRTRKPQFACEPLTNQSLGTCFAHLERRPGPMKMLVGGSAGAAKIKKNCQSLPIRSRPQKLLWRSVPLQAKTRLHHAIALANNFRRSALADQALAILPAVCPD
jgi:hypothetical protein